MTRKFITLAVLAGALAAPAVSAHAQDGTAAPAPQQGAMRGPGGGRGMRGGPGGGGMMNPMMKGIELTQAQKDSLKVLNDKWRADMEAERQSGAAPDPAKRQADMKKRSDAMRAILTADQQKVFDKNAEDMKKMMEEWQKNGGPPGGRGGRGAYGGQGGNNPPPPPPPQG